MHHVRSVTMWHDDSIRFDKIKLGALDLLWHGVDWSLSVSHFPVDFSISSSSTGSSRVVMH